MKGARPEGCAEDDKRERDRQRETLLQTQSESEREIAVGNSLASAQLSTPVHMPVNDHSYRPRVKFTSYQHYCKDKLPTENIT